MGKKEFKKIVPIDENLSLEEKCKIKLNRVLEMKFDVYDYEGIDNFENALYDVMNTDVLEFSKENIMKAYEMVMKMYEVLQGHTYSYRLLHLLLHLL